MGAVLRNVPHIDIASGIPRDWSSNIRLIPYLLHPNTLKASVNMSVSL